MVWGLAIFEQVEVVLGEVGNQRAVLVFDVEEQLDDFDVDLEGFDRLVLRLAPAGAWGEAGAGATGVGVGAFCAAEGSDSDRATTKQPASRLVTGLQCSLGISVFIPRLC
jgi:hypothetical protein